MAITSWPQSTAAGRHVFVHNLSGCVPTVTHCATGWPYCADSAVAAPVSSDALHFPAPASLIGGRRTRPPAAGARDGPTIE